MLLLYDYNPLNREVLLVTVVTLLVQILYLQSAPGYQNRVMLDFHKKLWENDGHGRILIINTRSLQNHF